MSDEPKDIADIIDRKAEPASEPSRQETQTASEPQPDEAGRLRDPATGKFASKEPKPPVAAAPAEPVTGVKPTEPTAPPAVAPSQPPHGFVPTAALIDQRLEARQFKQRAADLERRLEEATRPKPEPVDFYADPDKALNQRLEPFQQRLEQTISTLTLRASKAEAIAAHGKQAVTDMERAVGEAMESGDPEIMALRASMLSSDDPVGVAMNWYQHKRVLSEVGPDPVAYREKLKAELLAEMNQPAATQSAPVLPSNLAGARNVGNRSGPPWAGPKPLTDIFARK